MPEPDAGTGGTGVPDHVHHIVLYDGECGVCDWAVQWLLARDASAQLYFAPLQGPTTAALRHTLPEIPTDLDTMVYVTGPPGERQAHLRSRAVLRLLGVIGGGWAVIGWLRVLPAALTDLGYRAFAAARHRVSAALGLAQSCRLATEDEARRFLP